MPAVRILAKFATCSLIVEEQEYGELVQVTRLNPVERSILTRLSLATPMEILRKNLPPPLRENTFRNPPR